MSITRRLHIVRALDWLLGLTLGRLIPRCSHMRTTFPQTTRSKVGIAGPICTVSCLDCGTQFHYDWNEMKRGGAIDPTCNDYTLTAGKLDHIKET